MAHGHPAFAHLVRILETLQYAEHRLHWVLQPTYQALYPRERAGDWWHVRVQRWALSLEELSRRGGADLVVREDFLYLLELNSIDLD